MATTRNLDTDFKQLLDLFNEARALKAKLSAVVGQNTQLVDNFGTQTTKVKQGLESINQVQSFGEVLQQFAKLNADIAAFKTQKASSDKLAEDIKGIQEEITQKLKALSEFTLSDKATLDLQARKSEEKTSFKTDEELAAYLAQQVSTHLKQIVLRDVKDMQSMTKEILEKSQGQAADLYKALNTLSTSLQDAASSYAKRVMETMLRIKSAMGNAQKPAGNTSGSSIQPGQKV